jgi:hypothetical protein
MILLVANEFDTNARWLAERWTSFDVRILSPSDLSRPGWYFQPGSLGAWAAVVDGEVCDAQTPLNGVINLLPSITQEQLPHIVPEDQAYVAQEMNSFLLSWESELSCPVVNRPTPNCLIGPNLSLEEWVLLAARLGLPVKPINHSSNAGSRSNRKGLFHNAIAATVIGDQVFCGSEELQSFARPLAHAANVDLGVFYFTRESNAKFLGASLQADLTNDAAADAVLELFPGCRPC